VTYSFDERPESRTSSALANTEVREYVSVGVVDSVAAQALATVASPAVIQTAWGLLYKQDVQVKPCGWNI
jgi:predicted lysophospholipase L1 biosynthesis ABC-type transport system permease subunit